MESPASAAAKAAASIANAKVINVSPRTRLLYAGDRPDRAVLPAQQARQPQTDRDRHRQDAKHHAPHPVRVVGRHEADVEKVADEMPGQARAGAFTCGDAELVQADPFRVAFDVVVWRDPFRVAFEHHRVRTTSNTSRASAE
jgi:hypothetical protein